MPNTARSHFDEDIARAEAMLEQANAMEAADEPNRLYQDIRIASIAMAIGAMDAYLCDKYVDCLTSVLNAYWQSRWNGDLPSAYSKEKLPAGFVLDTSRTSRTGWSIRMAARSIMERENILSLSRVNSMFNPILPVGQKIWADIVPDLLAIGRKRLTGPKTASEVAALTGSEKGKANKAAAAFVRKRIAEIAQIRHDWIHNCSRPKSAIETYTHGEADVRIRDVKEVVVALDNHIEAHRKA